MDDSAPTVAPYRTKLRRILLVSEVSCGHEWASYLEPFTNDVCHLNLTTWSCADLIGLPYSCVVIDGRAENLMDTGMLVAEVTRYFPPRPVLYFYDERTGAWDLAMMTGAGNAVVDVPLDGTDIESAITAFMMDMVGYDPEDTDNWLAGLGQRQGKTRAQLEALLHGSQSTVRDIAAMTVDEFATGLGHYDLTTFLDFFLGPRDDLKESPLGWVRRHYGSDRAFVKLCLASSYTPGGAKRWWTRPRRALDGKTPLALWDTDRERVVALAMAAFRPPVPVAAEDHVAETVS